MAAPTESPLSDPPDLRRHPWDRRIAIITIVTVLAAVGIVVWVAAHNVQTARTFRLHPPGGKTKYPIGIVDATAPSGMAPPAPDALKGYTLSYSTDFDGTTLPPGWDVFTGVPGGDPGGHFDAKHVVVGNGLLSLNTWRDPAYANKWVTGGLCQCGVSHVYAGYFVRSRITGGGPNEVELLWPLTNVWPPEVDFNETGSKATRTSATVHFGAANNIDQLGLAMDMTKWHTWGVIVSKKAITFTVDGEKWGIVTAKGEIPSKQMTLDLEQRASCQAVQDCPKVPVTMQVDWVAEYTPI